MTSGREAATLKQNKTKQNKFFKFLGTLKTEICTSLCNEENVTYPSIPQEVQRIST